MAEAALLSVSTGVLKPLLSKLTKLLSDKYVKLKWGAKAYQLLARRAEYDDRHTPDARRCRGAQPPDERLEGQGT